jgi:KDO2-lipid IV(A) lauroyltransferase
VRDPQALLLTAWLALTGALPWRVRRVFAWLIAAVLWVFDTRSARTTRRNLELCLPELDERERLRLARRSLWHTALLACELGLAWRGPAARWQRRLLAVEGLEHLERAQAAGKGVLMLVPHFGNWEVLGQFVAARGPVIALYREARQSALAAAAFAGRARTGARLAPTTRAGVAQLLRSLHAGETLFILPDQQPDESGGVFAEFFGIAAFTPTIVAALLRRTGSGCVLGACERRRDGFVIRFERVDPAVADPDPVCAATALNAAIEALVRRAPEQYQWEYRRFARRPPGAPKLYSRSQPPALRSSA